ncbi:MAG: efflux RND transporter permease subunit, partial [Gemmatimonadetes bacterium]|nr:efflux RND transporter permease subunit [Gemmatimonadota bacterium]
MLIVAGLVVAPFDWHLGPLPRDPVPVDAIPDLGENQQILFTEWPGRSPRDVEDQITYPLTASLLGLPGVRTVRSNSFFGFSSIYVIFEENVDFYWSRSRILEKLASLPKGTLPEGVQPALGPDATGLGQVFWYTLEGRDADGNPAPGWDPQELRTIQDFQVKYALAAVHGVAEVASVGGHVAEYQVDVDPDALRARGVTLAQVTDAVRRSNADVGARTLEIANAEYVVRGIGFLRSVEDLEESVVVAREGAPVRIRDVAHVSRGPALRRGVLDKDGAEAVGGVVVVRYGENPLAAIRGVKEKIAEIAPGLPVRTLEDGRVSRVTVVPFYDRTGLIHETLGTLNDALSQEVLITIVVVLVMIGHLATSALVSLVLPLAVLVAFLGMKLVGLDANVVSLAGIAIAIGTIVDMGIVVLENVLRHAERAEPGESRVEIVRRATTEVGGAVLTAILTTVVSFLPVFTMHGPEGKMFRPLAWTKTLTLLASVIVALTILPTLATFQRGLGRDTASRRGRWIRIAVIAVAVVFLAVRWLPLGPGRSTALNLLFVGVLLAFWLGGFWFFRRSYPRLLGWCLAHKAAVLGPVAALLVGGGFAWSTLGKEFLPPLDEGSFLYMPTTMPHASLGEARDVLSTLDRAIGALPEVELAVGKIGRVDSALDPAPISMVETVVQIKPEYGVDENGHRVRQWRDEIRDLDDVWNAITEAAQLPGTTSAPRLQPIAARQVMLQSGMRAPMGVKVRGPDLETIERVGLEIEKLLKEVPGVEASAVLADRVVGKPYLEIEIDREALARYGLHVRDVQDVIEVAIGGRAITRTVEGRERYDVRVRYLRELRDSPEALGGILVSAPSGVQIPLRELATFQTVRGPQSIKSEDTFLVAYVVFDRRPGTAEVDVVEAARDHLRQAVADGRLEIPSGVSYQFAGSFENQVRSERRLKLVLPLALAAIVLLLQLQFRRISVTLLVFSGVFVAWAGGFVLLWLYGQPWWLDVPGLGGMLRETFHVGPINLSVAVWVGFLALFGIATDD